MSKLVRNVSSRQSLRALACLLVFVFAFSLSSMAQQKITLRFLDYQTGKPVSNIAVLATFWHGTSNVAKISAKTNKDGAITVAMAANPSERLGIISGDTVNPVSAEISVSEILGKGAIVHSVTYDKSAPKLEPAVHPGEVIILTEKLTLGKRVAREIP
jgi:hypothetical protein